MDKKTRAEIIIRGKVQGVFFRVETQKAAKRIGGVSGWVRNKADGSVQAVCEGDETSIQSMIKWCNTGSPSARVDDVEVVWKDYSGKFDGFEITY
ncbi:acylphosphatase [Desulfobacterales bacterium HSG16]|nr:acylphosphatase [Desulfobacterales bacterium HSG16]